nr:uncharacterized protein LOC105869205 isoform X4 [Microcebus murinus]
MCHCVRPQDERQVESWGRNCLFQWGCCASTALGTDGKTIATLETYSTYVYIRVSLARAPARYTNQEDIYDPELGSCCEPRQILIPSSASSVTSDTSLNLSVSSDSSKQTSMIVYRLLKARGPKNNR